MDLSKHLEEKTVHTTKGYGYSYRYSCSFCERGFSNAQALGGHMNVHRRDRACKIIQFSHGSSNHHHLFTNLEDGAYSELDKNHKKVQLLPDHDHKEKLNGGGGRVLFADQASSQAASGNTKMEVLRSAELDLELRLGPS